MLMTDVIVKKREGEKLSAEEIKFVVDGYTKGEIPDYQMSALLMAILLRGMDREETLELTMAMRDSGETLDLSAIKGVKADKHSTGGVGDKTSLILCPMVAAQGVKIAKMSGRGLGHTGGTIDKLESFPGFNTGISEEKFIENVNSFGIAIAGQTADSGTLQQCSGSTAQYRRDLLGFIQSGNRFETGLKHFEMRRRNSGKIGQLAQGKPPLATQGKYQLVER